MASREEIESLRALVRAKHKAATRKVSRLKVTKDVHISGTRLDPRRDLQNVKKLNTKQLQHYAAQLDQFVSRETSFVAGAKGTPLSGSLWKQHETLRKAVNKKNATAFQSRKDIFVPSVGMTVEQFHGTKPVHPVTGNPASRAPHLPIERSPRGVPNDRALKKLIKDLQVKASPDFGEKVQRRDKKILNKFLKDIGKVSPIADIKRDVKGLTSKQFQFLWNDTRFADISSFDYEIAKSKLHDKAALSQYDAAFDTQLREMRKILKDVKTLDL